MVGEAHPLILVFYIDRDTISNVEFMTVFSESINQYIAQSGSNIMAFFLPTDREERVECINPVLLAKPDMDKVNTLVNDIATQFGMAKPEDIRDYSFLTKGDAAYAFRTVYEYDSEDEELLAKVIDSVAIKLESASRRSVTQLRANSCFKELLESLTMFHEEYTITYDDSLDTDVVFIFSDEIFNLKNIPAQRSGEIKNLPVEEATEGEIREHKARLWGYVKVENYDRV